MYISTKTIVIELQLTAPNSTTILCYATNSIKLAVSISSVINTDV
jgi:hypothetical protein